MALRSNFKIQAKTPAAAHARSSVHLAHGFADSETADLGYKTLMSDLEGVLGERSTIAAEPEPRHRRVAMLVTHGMGQQVPYETVSAIGQALVTERTTGSPAAPSPVVNVRRVTLSSAEGAPEVSRAEVCLADAGGDPVDVHIYESYWAPFTEGQISFLQTVAFLYSAAWNGIQACLSSGYVNKRGRYFDRWMFGDFHPMKIKAGSLLMLLLLVGSMSLVLVPAFLLFTPTGWEALRWLGTHGRSWFLAFSPIQQIAAVLVVLLLAVFAYWVHYFIVEFAGDVAIYVSSYKVSRFDAIRNAILKQTCSMARQIYSAGMVDHQEQPYDSVVIVGHSLGSVISYDLLNASINWDQVECGSRYRVVDRTTRLITFGSPLDKTAFLFRTQCKSNRNLREALAARQQPLILDYTQFRPIETFRWINIYAHMDIVSGHLDYYDVSGMPGFNPVENRVDGKARIPLIAHTQYWDNEALHKALYEAVWAHALA